MALSSASQVTDVWAQSANGGRRETVPEVARLLEKSGIKVGMVIGRQGEGCDLFGFICSP